MEQHNFDELYNRTCKTDLLYKKRRENLIKARNRIIQIRRNTNNNILINRNLEEIFDNENNAENNNRLLNRNLEEIFDNIYYNNTENNAFFA